MIEDRTMIRTWVRSAPDGSATTQIERVNVQIRWLGGKPEDGKGVGNYAWASDWILMPRESEARDE